MVWTRRGPLPEERALSVERGRLRREAQQAAASEDVIGHVQAVTVRRQAARLTQLAGGQFGRVTVLDLDQHGGRGRGAAAEGLLTDAHARLGVLEAVHR